MYDELHFGQFGNVDMFSILPWFIAPIVTKTASGI